jgi:hypothetical protein
MIQQGQISVSQTSMLSHLLQRCGNGGIRATLIGQRVESKTIMRTKLHLSALIAMSLIGVTTSAFAQGAGAAAVGNAPGVGTNPPVGAPPNPATTGITPAPGTSSTTTTGLGTTGLGTTGLGAGSRTNLSPGITNQSGVPNTSTPGTIGTGASPSGLPGDDPAYPAFPGKVGQ